ncbi:uncharacterized protein NPIL_227801 [Nephila pilipes]|uniref:DUF5641 domain-containing protein n=1 Tax=Nephila pilipes TaxID=299642 RepID=A0A8X6I3T0_NEPPI|nr:uncharacterized protein NPIL_227801 [Nephila pilipes]
MRFLSKEIEGEEKINLANLEFGLEYKNKKNQPMKSFFNRNKNITTGMELYSSVQAHSTKEITNPKLENGILVHDQILANVSSTPHVLQTLAVYLRGEKGKVKIRTIIDSTSQRSYVLNSTAQKLNYHPHRRESLQHSLFSVENTEICHHDVYKALLTDVSLNYNCNFEVLGQETICATIPSVADGSWMKKLFENNIHLSDQRQGPLELLIGMDVAGKLQTGGDVVLIESTAKRVNWPLGKVVHLIEGKDGVVLLAKIRAKHGDLLRPIQRLYPLEVSSPIDEDLHQQIEGHTICDKRDESNISSDSSSLVPDSGEG